MAGPIQNSNMEEIDCASFFDHIDDLLDFPMNDEDFEAGLTPKIDSFPSIWSTESDSVFSNPKSDLSAQLSVPYQDIVELDWLSNFVDDSFSGGGAVTCTIGRESSNLDKDEPLFHTQFLTTRPVSILDSSSSSSSPSPPYGEKPAPAPHGLIPVNSGRKGKARSKRPRPATFNPPPSMQIISPTASSVSPQPLSDSENYAESRPTIKIPKQKKKKMIVKPTIIQGSDEAGDGTPSAQPVRKCLHCEITKTPQWRAGPMGPKTLCNACGVRHKSGRLFPEYRPAASPTFVPSVHSNSHKKVLEMRSKIGSGSTANDTVAELIPNPAIQSDGM